MVKYIRQSFKSHEFMHMFYKGDIYTTLREDGGDGDINDSLTDNPDTLAEH